MRRIKFFKMHGLGNSFIFLDLLDRSYRSVDYSDLARSICDISTGVGADGLILIGKSRRADFAMRIINSDGSEAEMCGNGLRCMVRYLYDNQLASGKKMNVDTLAGRISAEVVDSSKNSFKVKVAMGRPVFDTDQIPVLSRSKEHIEKAIRVNNQQLKITVVSMGNPHAVCFVEDFDFDLHLLGPMLENHKIFPERANVEFVKVLSSNRIALKSWERGAGPTSASGTGASASVAAGIKTGRLRSEVDVRFENGNLALYQDPDEHVIYQSGPAEYILCGEYYYRG
ncbi:MAG: diaminopimelate epimerase [candidate division Zixibacteria bacterium]|nr:diaminopimelate epimerase [candidate division Zixibacteria bacterium]